MDLDSALQRYLSNPDVARWLFSTEDIKTVTAEALDSCFVYAIGFGRRQPGQPRDMDIEDMLIVTGASGTFLLGFLWGLSQPHVFSLTPLMLDRRPIARRFAVDMSTQDALEFMEFLSFDDGKTIVMFRQFLHTHDQSLPVVACATLHAASNVEQTLGPLLMRADLFEAASCPVCGHAGRKCRCTFDSYAPNTLVRKSTFNWNQFSSRIMNKARSGTIKLQMIAFLPGVGEMRIMDKEIAAVNVLQKGSTEYMTLLRRKAVHGLGINVLVPRADAQVLSQSIENDFVDLHNSYVSRKRVRDLEESDALDFLQEIEDAETLDITGALLDSVTGPLLKPSLNTVLPDAAPFKPNEFILSPIPYTNITAPNMDNTIEPLSLQTTVVAKEETEPALIESNFFAKGSPATLDPLLSTDFSATRPPAPGQMSELTGRETDILRDIELILSPDGGPTCGEKQPEYMPNVDLLDNSTTNPNVQWTSSISSEDSASDRKPRKTATATTKPPKRARAPSSRGQVSAQTSSDSTSESDKKHVCKMCTSRFKMRGDLLRHVKTVHEGKKMYTCKTCGKAFGHSGHLNRHVSSVHLQQRRFKCQFCGFQFFQASHLQSHIGHIHSAKKPYRCEFCGVRVNSEAALKSHMAKTRCAEAVAEEAISCSFHGCNSKFSSQYDLDAHKALVHQAVVHVMGPSAQYHALPS